MKKNNQLEDMAKTILNSTFKFSQEKVELLEISKLLTEWESKGEEHISIKQYSYCICVIEIIRNIANGELEIPVDDRLQLIELITEHLKGNVRLNIENIIKIDFTNKTIM